MPPRTNQETLSLARNLRRQLTAPELFIWQAVRHNQVLGVRFRRQVPIGRYVADFACLRPRIVIELDGGQHGDALAYDAARTAYLQKQGFRVLRFWNNEVMMQRQTVLDAIWTAVKSALDAGTAKASAATSCERPHPPPAAGTSPSRGKNV